MKIAVWHNLPSGGGKRALYYQVRGLVRRGHTVEAWCPPTADRTYLPLADLVPEHVVPLEWEAIKSANPAVRAWANYANVVKKLAALDRHCRECAQEIGVRGFDVLFANGDRDFLAPPIGRHIDLPSLLYLQEPARALYEAAPLLPWVAIPQPRRWSPVFAARWLHNLLKVQGLRVQAREEQLNAAAFSTILVNSFFSRESVLRAYGLDSRVCYLGVDTELFHNEGREREPLIVGLGAVIPAKGVSFVIEALAAMSEPRPRLVWVGNTAIPLYLEETKAFARARGVDFEVRVRISDSELVQLLNSAKALAYAPRLEPFGFAPLEANACGLPVVAVAEGGIRETIVNGQNGLLVTHSPEAMARALDRLLGDPELASQLGAQARQIAEEKWSLEEAVSRIECEIQRTVGLKQA